MLKVVATIEIPASHQGTDRPETKNSAVPLPARLPKNKEGTKQIASERIMIIQSSGWRCMGYEAVLAIVCRFIRHQGADRRRRRLTLGGKPRCCPTTLPPSRYGKVRQYSRRPEP